jgi:hypothetical protein
MSGAIASGSLKVVLFIFGGDRVAGQEFGGKEREKLRTRRTGRQPRHLAADSHSEVEAHSELNLIRCEPTGFGPSYSARFVSMRVYWRSC